MGDPDPFTAIQNALQFYPVDEIVISTLPGERSGWLRADLIERVAAAPPASRSSTSWSTIKQSAEGAAA